MIFGQCGEGGLVGKYIIKVIIAVLVLAAITVIAGAWMVWKRPLTIDAWMSRLALKINGLEKHELDTESGRMTVWEGGSGPTLVLLHGAGDQAGAWARTIGGLISDYRVVIPDLPGHGGSDPHSGPIHMEQLLDGIDRVMDAYCADEPVTIIGNSMGAWLGFLYARDNPGRVERLVAVNGGPIVELNPRVNIFPTTRDEARATMKGLMGPASPPIPGFVLDDIVRRTTNGPAARFAQTAGEMGPYLLDGRLDQVTVPVELVWGAADQLLTIDYAQRMVDGLPRARLHPINGCGHVPQRECPLRFLEVLTEALAAPPAEPRMDEDVSDDEKDPGATGMAEPTTPVILSTAMRRSGAYPWNDGGQNILVILSERSEPKNPPKLGRTMLVPRSSYPRGTLPTSLSELVGTARLRSLGGYSAPNDKDPCHPERSDLRGRVVEGSPEGWKTAPVGSSHRPSGDSSTHSRTRSLRMTGAGCSVIPGVGAASRRGGAQGDMGWRADSGPGRAA